MTTNDSDTTKQAHRADPLPPDRTDRGIMWDSPRMIGRVHERYSQLTRKNYDWRSFYSGWIEGRFAMLAEIRENPNPFGVVGARGAEGTRGVGPEEMKKDGGS